MASKDPVSHKDLSRPCRIPPLIQLGSSILKAFLPAKPSQIAATDTAHALIGSNSLSLGPQSKFLAGSKAGSIISRMESAKGQDHGGSNPDRNRGDVSDSPKNPITLEDAQRRATFLFGSSTANGELRELYVQFLTSFRNDKSNPLSPDQIIKLYEGLKANENSDFIGLTEELQALEVLVQAHG